MKKWMKKFTVVLCIMMLGCMLAACGDDKDGSTSSGSGSSDSGKTDAITGTWKQTDEVNGNWIWTFSDGSKAKLVGETTGFESDGTYTLDEANKKVTVTLEKWSEPTEFTYTLSGTSLKLEAKYNSYDLVKQ